MSKQTIKVHDVFGVINKNDDTNRQETPAKVSNIVEEHLNIINKKDEPADIPATISKYDNRKKALVSQDLRQDKKEFAQLCSLIEKERVSTFLEIGSCYGGSMYMIADFMYKGDSGTKIMCVDLPGVKWGKKNSAVRFRELARKVKEEGHGIDWAFADSHAETTVRMVRNSIGRLPLDCLFIDGDHRYDGVKRDFELYSPLVRKGGFVVLHDVAPNIKNKNVGVSQFFNEVKKDYETEEFITSDDNFGIGIIRIT